jgi:hypothetical protein
LTPTRAKLAPGEARHLIELWWEEGHDADGLRRRLNEKLDRIGERMYHGDEAALLYWALHETRATDVLHPLERVKNGQLVDAMFLCEMMWFNARLSSDPSPFVDAFLALPHRLRREFLRRAAEPIKDIIVELVGEAYEVLDKAYVEIAVPMDVRAAVELARRHGRGWRARARELLARGLLEAKG